MIKTIIHVVITLTIALGGGATSVWYMLDEAYRPGAMTIGVWTAYPASGTPDADPYTKARISRDAELPLGAAEGLVFFSRRDSGGDLLRRECEYRIEGPLPAARLWTLYPADERLHVLPRDPAKPGALHSRRVIYKPDGSLSVSVSPQARPDNWLALGGSGPLVLILTFYDTELSTGTGAADVALPQILRIGCDG